MELDKGLKETLSEGLIQFFHRLYSTEKKARL